MFTCRLSFLTPQGEAKLVQWSLLTGQVEVEYEGHAGEVTSLAIHLDGRSLATGSADKTVRLWDLRTGDEKSNLAAEVAGTDLLGFVAGGRTLVTRRSEGGSYAVSFWRGASDGELAPVLMNKPSGEVETQQ